MTADQWIAVALLVLCAAWLLIDDGTVDEEV